MKASGVAFLILLFGIPNVPAATHFVSRQSPNPAPPYATWDTAARNIQDVVNVAEAGATVVVTNGVYPGLITVGKSITLLSVNGAPSTILDGGGTNRCLCLDGNAANSAYLSGFTLTNARVPSSPSIGYWDGGAVWSSWREAYLTNCILSGNWASNGGAAYGARLYNCAVTNNSASSSGGATYSCELYNCTLTGNTAEFRGGGACFSVLHNSIVYYNTSPNGPNFDSLWGATNSCTTPLAAGESNITGEPLFVDYAAGNLRLQSGSPCIDTGENWYANGETDLDGSPRLAGASVDIGAYEFQGSGPPRISLQPVSQTAYVGDRVVFTVSASGSAPLSRQWRHNDAPIPDATNSSLTLASLELSDAGRYSVLITNSLGSETSQVAVLTVMDAAPIITQQPESREVFTGSHVFFFVNAVGSLPLSRQWRFNGIPITYGTNGYLAIPFVTTSSAGNYDVVVTNRLGAVTSRVAVLTVRLNTNGNPPTITLQPQSQTVYAGSNVTVSVGATGTSPFTYQWRFNGNPIPSETGSVLTLPSVTTVQAGNYSAIVSNSLGSATSQVAVLTVLDSAPSITLQPQSREVTAGLSVTFTSGAQGSLPMSPQWLFNGAEIPDATNWTLTLPAVTTDHAGTYSVVVSNALGTATSSEALLTVRVPQISYVWQDSPNPTSPYLTWATAAHTIQEAVDAVYAGDQVVVTNGVYATGGRTVSTSLLTNRVAVDKAVTVRSVNGPEVTIIQGYQMPGVTNGPAAVRCVYLAPNAHLIGFTLTNGATTTEYGAYKDDSGGGVFGAWSSYDALPRASNCRIINNCAFYDGGGAYICALNNCLVVSNTAGNDGGGSLLGLLTNCTIVGNSALRGGGAAVAAIYNSIIYYNGGEDLAVGKGSTFSYCCTPAWGFPYWQNISAEPRFADLAAGDFHLQPDSPCINAGKNEYASATVDLDGNPRTVGAHVDIGAYEFPSPSSALSYAWLQQYGLATDGSADCADPDGDGLDNTQEYACRTVPTNAASALRLVSAIPTTTNVTVTWQSEYGILYSLERSTNVAQPFSTDNTNTVIGTNIFGYSGTTTFQDTAGQGKPALFYRIGVKQP